MIEDNKVKIIGITGTVGAGKSTVASIYAQLHHACVIYTDNIAKDLQEQGNTCYNQIVDYFGKGILDINGDIDRSKLAEIVFNDENELSVLNSFVHKEVIKKVKSIIKHNMIKEENSIILIESAILFQVEELKALCDEIWYVDSKDSDRRERLKRERNYSDERINSMMNSQECIHLIKEECDKVIINDKDIKVLKDILANM